MKLLKNEEQCPHCGRFGNRGMSVDAIIIKDKKILLIKRGSELYKGYWGTPGGYVGWDETIEDALKREVKEETGLTVTTMKFMFCNSDPSRHPKQVVNFVYYVSEYEGNVAPSDDALECEWFQIDSLPERLAFDHKENIKESLKLIW